MLVNIFRLNLDFLKYLFLLLLFWIAINTGSKYVDFEEIFFSDFKTSVNQIRAILPYFVLFYFIFKKKFFLNYNLIFLFFIFYALFQFLGLVYNFKNLHEHYWLICLVSLLVYFQNVLNNKNKNLKNLIFFCNIVFILIIFLIFIILAFKENFFINTLLYHSKAFKIQFANELVPRSSGISRMAIIIFIFSNSLIFSNLLSASKKITLFLKIFNIFLIFCILTLQSRGVIIFFFILFILINLIYNFNGLKERIIYFCYILIIPSLIFFYYPILKKSFLENYADNLQNNSELASSSSDHFREDFFTKNKKNNIKNNNKLVEFSNNRINAWNFLTQIFLNDKINESMKKKLAVGSWVVLEKKYFLKKNLITGYGPQADRYIMTNVNEPLMGKAYGVLGPFGAHASNVFIYSLVCGGFLGLITILIINLIIFYKIIIIYLNRKKINLQQDYILNSSILIVLFLLFRGLIENSYGVFGVDLILLISSFVIILDRLKSSNEK